MKIGCKKIYFKIYMLHKIDAIVLIMQICLRLPNLKLVENHKTITTLCSIIIGNPVSMVR
jgi:hypothetical protein